MFASLCPFKLVTQNSYVRMTLSYIRNPSTNLVEINLGLNTSLFYDVRFPQEPLNVRRHGRLLSNVNNSFNNG